MPHKGAWTEPDFVTSLLKAPADIHVISGAAENGIESAEFGQNPFVDGEVAPGDMFGLAIRKHDVRRSPGRSHHRRRSQRILRRQKIGAADGNKIAIQ